MGTFAPAVDYLTVKKVREAVMGATHDASIVNSFMTNFGYTTSDPVWVLVPPGNQHQPGWRSRRATPAGTGGSGSGSSSTAGGGAAAVQVVRKRVGAPVRVVRPPADGVARTGPGGSGGAGVAGSTGAGGPALAGAVPQPARGVATPARVAP